MFSRLQTNIRCDTGGTRSPNTRTFLSVILWGCSSRSLYSETHQRSYVVDGEFLHETGPGGPCRAQGVLQCGGVLFVGLAGRDQLQALPLSRGETRPRSCC